MHPLNRRLSQLESVSHEARHVHDAAPLRARLLARLSGLGQRMKATDDMHNRASARIAHAEMPSAHGAPTTIEQVREIVHARLRRLGFNR